MTWLAAKGEPTKDFDKWEWTNRYGFDAWANKGRTLNLDATAAYVLWEQTVRAEELMIVWNTTSCPTGYNKRWKGSGKARKRDGFWYNRAASHYLC